MATRELTVQRFSVTSSKSFRDVVAAFEAAVGHPEIAAFEKSLSATKTYAELESLVRSATGRSDLMEFMRVDLGGIVRKQNGPATPNSLRFVVGNPLIMTQMLQHVPDTGSYAPVTVLIDERPDGVHLSYDKMASFLAPYGNEEALRVARDLDSKVENILIAAAE